MVVVVRSGILKHTLPVAILGCKAAINQDIKCFDSGDDQLNRWLALALKANSPLLLGENREGTTVQSVKLETLTNFVLVIPPIAEQRRITRKLDQIRKKLEEIEARYKKAMTSVEKLMPSILAKAFRGELS